MLCIHIYVPTADNTGHERCDVLHAARNILHAAAGGSTLHGPAVGFWTDPRTDTVYLEGVRVLEVVAEDTPDLRAAVAEAKALIARELAQISVFVTAHKVEIW